MSATYEDEIPRLRLEMTNTTQSQMREGGKVTGMPVMPRDAADLKKISPFSGNDNKSELGAFAIGISDRAGKS